MASKKTSKKPRRARKKPTPRRKVASKEKPDDVVIIETEGGKITGVTSTAKRLKVVTVDYLEDEDDGIANFRMGGLLAVRTVYQAKRATKEIVAAMLGEGEPLDEEEYECTFCGRTFDDEDELYDHDCDADDEDDEDDG